MNYTRLVFLLRFSAIGDVIIALRNIPVLQKNNYLPIFVTSIHLKPLLERSIFLKHYICFDEKNNLDCFVENKRLEINEFKKYLISLNCSKNPAILDLQKTSKSYLGRRTLIKNLHLNKVDFFSAKKRTLYRFFLILWSRFSFFQRKGKNAIMENLSISKIQLNLIESLFSADKSPSTPSIFTEKYIQPLTKNVLPEYLCVFPGSSGPLKSWPKENFQAFIKFILDNTDLCVVICGGKTEQWIGEFLEKSFSKERIFNYVDRMDIGSTIDLIAEAKYVIGNDSFQAHAADAMHIPAAVIFGATSPKFGFAPLFEKIKIYYSNLNCSPCSRHGKGSCRFKNLKCLTETKPSDVFSDFIANR